MDSASESTAPFSDQLTIPSSEAPPSGSGFAVERDRVRRPRGSRARWASLPGELRWVLYVYLGTRVLLIGMAIVEGAIRHHSVTHELANWDGLWYRELANKGYPDHPSFLQTPLGFFPLYSIVIWAVGHSFAWTTTHGIVWAITLAGVVVSMVGGLIATVIVYRLAESWWNPQSARRAAALFCVFPGSVVFSMVYSEGIMIPLIAGCLLALQRRRWLLAGILAGLSTAVEPAALAIVPVCVVSAGLELRRRGWRLRDARRAVLAPLLSITGIGTFALFLWAWTGTPLATYQAQHHGWSEKTDLLAMVHLTTRLASEISLAHLDEPAINLNLVAGLVGALLLAAVFVLMWDARRAMSVEAIVWTLFIAFLALTSEFTPPNPRMLIVAFPALMILGHYVRGRGFTVLMWTNGVLLVVMSWLTFVGITLRP
ncbi:MAG TPA: mannosyltransferase family protein [Solirubrobacteraceae bacterium]